MTVSNPCFCSPYNFGVGRRLLNTLGSVYDQSTYTYKGCVHAREKPCVLFIPAPCALPNEYLRVVDFRNAEESAFPVDCEIRKHVRDTVSLVCRHSITIVAVDESIATNDFARLLRDVEKLFGLDPEAEEPEVPAGHDPLSYTFGVAGDIDLECERLPRQHSPGGVDKFGYD